MGAAFIAFCVILIANFSKIIPGLECFKQRARIGVSLAQSSSLLRRRGVGGLFFHDLRGRGRVLARDVAFVNAMPLGKRPLVFHVNSECLSLSRSVSLQSGFDLL